MSSTAAPPQEQIKTRKKPASRPETRDESQTPWLWHVVLHDDDEHSYPYVVDMMQRVFQKSFQDGYLMAQIVDRSGRVICETTHKERAEFKRNQILGYGADPLIPRSRGSMKATIEPAQSSSGDDDGRS